MAAKFKMAAKITLFFLNLFIHTLTTKFIQNYKKIRGKKSEILNKSAIFRWEEFLSLFSNKISLGINKMFKFSLNGWPTTGGL
jgi:hypothetical protein